MTNREAKQPIPEPWHCHVERGQTYADLVAQHGPRAMLTAILVLPQLHIEELRVLHAPRRHGKLAWLRKLVDRISS